MTRNEMIRIRRQMHRRIREIVAERRVARLNASVGGDTADRGLVTVDTGSTRDEESLIG